MRVVFMGTPEFAVPVLDLLIEKYEVVAVVTREDKPKGRKHVLCAPPVKEVALNNGLTVLQPKSARNEAFIEEIRNLEPDLFVTAAYGCILPKELLDIPRFGCVNVHASLLPKYRGAGPIQRAIIDGETQTGITTMMTDVGMDTGDILMKSVCPIDENMNSDELSAKLTNMAPALLDETLKKLFAGELERIPQDEKLATYAPMLDSATGVIDWSKSSKELHDLVRGTYPWPSAISTYANKKIKIAQTQIVYEQPLDIIQKLQVEVHSKSQNGAHLNQQEQNKIVPGMVVVANKKHLTIACGEGFLDILRVQPESSKEMDFRSFINGRGIKAGDLFE